MDERTIISSQFMRRDKKEKRNSHVRLVSQQGTHTHDTPCIDKRDIMACKSSKVSACVRPEVKVHNRVLSGTCVQLGLNNHDMKLQVSDAGYGKDILNVLQVSFSMVSRKQHINLGELVQHCLGHFYKSEWQNELWRPPAVTS